MSLPRRTFFSASLAGLLGRGVAQPDATSWGMPGRFRGRVIAVTNPRAIVDDVFQAGPIQATIRKGMMELTDAPTWQDAWRAFFEPGDVVGIKVNPNHHPIGSSRETLLEIIDGLRSVGIRSSDIVVYDRYATSYTYFGLADWIPEGIRSMYASLEVTDVQTDMDGYDPEHYGEFPVPNQTLDPDDPRARRSYVAKFLTQEVNKMINVPVLKHHVSSGVTLCLKNMAYGLCNNINRSHLTAGANTVGLMIPTLASIPIIRRKTVLQILDGVMGQYNAGPSLRRPYVWPNQTMYFGTDPVAIDTVGLRVIDAKRQEIGMLPVAIATLDDPEAESVRMQPEHIELASFLGLGESNPEKIDLRQFLIE